MENLDWMESANCRGIDTEMFFPEPADKGGNSRQARKICARCSVQRECFIYAMENDIRFGIWGGTVERTRRRMRPKKQMSPAQRAAFRTANPHIAPEPEAS